MGYVYKGKNQGIIRAVEKLERELADPTWFKKGMVAGGRLTFTKSLPGDVADDMIEAHRDNVIEIRLYKAKSKKTLAVYRRSTPGVLFVNSRNLNRSDASIAGTIWHETGHFADHLNKNASYGHGNNSSKGKQNSAAYRAGSLMKLRVTEQDAALGLSEVRK